MKRIKGKGEWVGKEEMIEVEKQKEGREETFKEKNKHSPGYKSRISKGIVDIDWKYGIAIIFSSYLPKTRVVSINSMSGVPPGAQR